MSSFLTAREQIPVFAAGIRLREINDCKPGDELAQLMETRKLLTDAEKLLRFGVEKARAAGHTWGEIAEALKISRQAAHERFSKQ